MAQPSYFVYELVPSVDGRLSLQEVQYFTGQGTSHDVFNYTTGYPSEATARSDIDFYGHEGIQYIIVSRYSK